MKIHKSVMPLETIDNLLINNKGIYVDCTLGSGGHSLKIIDQLNEGVLICIDSDNSAVEDFKNLLITKDFSLSEVARFQKLERGKLTVYLVQDNFAKIKEILSELNISNVDGVLADLGWSSDQLSGIPGLSYENLEADLDMRLNNNLGVKASDLLNLLNAKALSTMFEKYADIRGANNRFMVERIVAARKETPFSKVQDILPILDKTVRNQNVKSFYSKVFQALRIAVNNEYTNLEKLLQESLAVLSKNGRVLVITFHSGEARIVEDFIRISSAKSIFYKNGNNYLVPSVEELQDNLSARSAKLFGLKKDE